MTFEELKQEFIDNGFQIDGNSFVCEREDPNVTINGQHPLTRFEMVYVYEGCVMNSDSEPEETFYEFDILGPNKEVMLTICITSFEDFTKMACE